jgi:NTE family protein
MRSASASDWTPLMADNRDQSRWRTPRARRARVIVLIAAALVASAPAVAAGDAPGRPRIGLVLGGGGARGAAHVGVLKVLEKLQVPIDCVAGTSMGAIVGGLYASGLSPADIERELLTIDWENIFDDDPPRQEKQFRRKRDDDTYLVKYRAGYSDGKLKLPVGLIQGQKFDLELSRLTLHVPDNIDFDDLPIPYRAVASDTGGHAVVLGSGSLARAIRASMAVPALFSAVEIDGKMLVDGGIANNVPVDVARELCGAEIVIVVDVGTGLLEQQEITSVLKMVDQLTRVLTVRNVEAQLASLTPGDVLITPDLGDVTSAQFTRAADAIAAGERAAAAFAQRLSALSAPAVAGPVRTPQPHRVAPPVIEWVRIDNQSRLGDDVIAALLPVSIGQPLDREALEAKIGELYGMELFQSIRYEVMAEAGRTGLLVHVVEHPWGPKYLQFGMALSDNFEGDATYNLGVSYLMTGLNRRAGEARIAAQIGEDPLISAEWYQPIDRELEWFVLPAALYDNFNVSRFEGGEQIDEFRITRYGAALAAGRVIGRYGEVRVGVRRYTGEAEVRVGDPTLPDLDIDAGQVYARASFDRLDNRNWPHRGTIARFDWIESLEGLGAADDYTQATLELGTVYTFDHTTVFGGINVASTVDGTASVDGRFRSGGFTRLSGFQQQELSGQDLAIIRTGFYHRLGKLEWLPIYAGATFEYGNVYEDGIEFSDGLFAGSVFVGLDSIIGPLYAGYGHAEQGNDSLYLFLGRLF